MNCEKCGKAMIKGTTIHYGEKSIWFCKDCTNTQIKEG